MIATRTQIALLCFAIPTAALADDLGPTEVCTVKVTETLTAPKKPNIFESELNCGAKPTDFQDYAIKLVHNAMNLADALEIMTDLGYEIKAGNTRDSYNGHQIISTYTLFAPTSATSLPDPSQPAPAAPSNAFDALPEADHEPESTDDLDLPDQVAPQEPAPSTK